MINIVTQRILLLHIRENKKEERVVVNPNSFPRCFSQNLLRPSKEPMLKWPSVRTSRPRPPSARAQREVGYGSFPKWKYMSLCFIRGCLGIFPEICLSKSLGVPGKIRAEYGGIGKWTDGPTSSPLVSLEASSQKERGGALSKIGWLHQAFFQQAHPHLFKRHLK